MTLRLIPWASGFLLLRHLHTRQTQRLWNVLPLRQMKWRTCILNPGRLITDLNSSLSHEAKVPHDPTAESQAFYPKLKTLYPRSVPPKL